MSDKFTFNYNTAFSRNIGWLTEQEQQTLRNKRVAIAGMGGVGGVHLLTLSRLGVGNFNISDYDTFELGNFNRQAGASVPHIDRPKAEVLAELAKNINPEQNINIFPDGVDQNNIDDFLKDVDVYVDGLDFFALEIRQQLFAACNKKNIPVIIAAPLGMGTAVINFLPGKMSFEDYFQLDGHNSNEQLIRFLVGLSPALLQRSYLVAPEVVDFKAHKVPSTPMGCELCAGVAATEALKVLLKRGKVLAAPWGYHFDAYTNRFKKTWRPWGNRNPVQKIALAIARKIIL